MSKSKKKESKRTVYLIVTPEAISQRGDNLRASLDYRLPGEVLAVRHTVAEAFQLAEGLMSQFGHVCVQIAQVTELQLEEYLRRETERAAREGAPRKK